MTRSPGLGSRMSTIIDTTLRGEELSLLATSVGPTNNLERFANGVPARLGDRVSLELTDHVGHVDRIQLDRVGRREYVTVTFLDASEESHEALVDRFRVLPPRSEIQRILGPLSISSKTLQKRTLMTCGRASGQV